MRFFVVLALVWPVAAQQMDSGMGAPSNSTGSDGDLYHRTDTGWIYGPKASGAWPTTYSVILGRGCTTAFHIDWYCTGLGVGGVDPNTSAGPVDPNPLFGVDAGLTGSSPDGTVHTTAQVMAKYSTPDAFYSAVGYSGILRYWAISPTGNDRTCTAKSTVALVAASACASFGPMSSLRAGDAIVVRAGSYTLNWTPATSGTSANPVILINYPGEYAKIDSGGGNALTLLYQSYITIDGLELVNSSGSYGGFGYGIDTGFNTGMVARNNWIHDFGDDIIAGDAFESPLIERNVTNNGGAGDGHDMYLGCRFTPCSGATVQDNIVYNGTSSPFQLNGRYPNLLFTRNTVHDGNGVCISMYNGVTNSTLSNNAIFNCENGVMGWLIYDGGCSTAGVCPYAFTGNAIINNTFVMTNIQNQDAIWYVNNAGSAYGFGSNTYENNGIITLNTYTPVAFQSGTQAGDVNSTYNSDILNGNGTTVVSTQTASYACSTLAGVATVSNCINADPLLVSMSNGE